MGIIFEINAWHKKLELMNRTPEAIQGANIGIFGKINKCEVGNIQNYPDRKNKHLDEPKKNGTFFVSPGIPIWVNKLGYSNKK